MNEEIRFEEGDCVQLNKENSPFHGAVGTVLIFRQYDSPQLCLVRFDDDGANYYNVKYLIKRDLLACAEG